jgi:hypothetical protein
LLAATRGLKVSLAEPAADAAAVIAVRGAHMCMAAPAVAC